jgi:hypothetical protein
MNMDSSKLRSVLFAAIIGIVAAFAYHLSGVFPAYEYRTDIFVGEYATGDGFQAFEPISATEQFVRDTLLIAPTTEELRKLGVSEVRTAAIVATVEAGKVLRVHSVSPEDGVDRVKAIHRFVADGILERLKPRVSYARARLDSRLSLAQENLKAALNEAVIFSEIMAEAKASEVKTREQARKLADQIAELDGAGRGVTLPNTRGDGAPTETIDLSIRGQLSMYQKLGLAEIPLLRADTARTGVSLREAVAQSRLAIRDLNSQIAVFREPAVTQFVSRSVSPARPALLVLLMVGLVAGLATYYATRMIRRAISS